MRHALGPLLLTACLTTAAAAEVDKAEGRRLFTQVAVPGCGICHVLDHAGTEGAIGPNLDELKPDAARVAKAVRNGIGQMPAFPALNATQVDVLSRYVAAASGAKP
jgi:cytochrome c6